jgi:hypothetical protein
VRYRDIRHHLKPYVIAAKRTTTINHAFAACVAPSDKYDEVTVREAIRILGQDPDQDLSCAYCGNRAETWDHVHATVKNKEFSGQAHRIGNLLPCCKPCNSKKGNKDWRSFLRGLHLTDDLYEEREGRIDHYLVRYFVSDEVPKDSPEYRKLQRIRRLVIKLIQEADKLASDIRRKSNAM